MKKAPIPEYDSHRLFELYQLNILDTESEPEFDKITKLASTVCDSKIAAISLVDKERQWFKSSQGLSVSETPRDISFCGHAIMGDNLFEVPDTEKHPDFFDNPLCVSDPNIRFYAGIPLKTSRGYRIGTLCVIDDKPKNLTTTQQDILKSLAEHVVGLIEQKRNHRELQKIQDQLEYAQEISKIGSWQWNALTHELICSKEYQQIFEDEFQSTSNLTEMYQKYIHPDDFVVFADHMNETLTKGKEFELHLRLSFDQGRRIKFVQAVTTVVLDKTEKVAFVRGTWRDISNVIEKEQQYHFYKHTLDDTAMVSMIDKKGTFLLVNANFCNAIEYKEAEIIGRHLEELIKDGEQNISIVQMWEEIQQNKKWNGLISVLSKSQKNLWFETTVVPNNDVILNEMRYIVIQKDVTSELLAKEALISKNKEIDSFFSVSLDMLCVAGVDGTFKRINPAFCEILGYSEAELLSEQFLNFIHPDDVEPTLQEIEQLSKGIPTIRFENRYRCKDGTFKRLSWTSSPEPDTGLLYAAARDVTEERYQTRLRQIISEVRALYINFKHDTAKLFDFILSKILEVTDGEYGFVGEIKIDPETNKRFLKTFALTNIAWNEQMRKFYDEHAPSGLEFKNLDTLFGWVIRTGEPMITNNPSQNPHAGGLPHGHPSLDAFLGVPIYHGGDFIGMIGIANRPNGFEQDIIQKLQPLIDVIGEIIFAHQMEKENLFQKDQIDKALKRAQAATQAKTEFLSTMSHEIRTPLHAIIGMSSLLAEHELSQEQQEFVQTIVDSGNVLLKLINDILDFSKIEAGKLDLDIDEFDITSHLENIIKPHKFAAIQKGLNFRADISTFPYQIRTDSGKIGQIINNLLSNALKFTEHGGVSISMHPTQQEEALFLSFQIQDTGIGITAEAQKYIFEDFVQAQQSTHRNFGGTGLGLAITKKLVELMGGVIHVESGVGVGTVFRVELPIQKGESISFGAKSTPTKTSGTSQKDPIESKLHGHILVAEDNPTNQFVIARILKKFGLTYVCVNNGKEVLDVLQIQQKEVFDLILMDCQMPILDGYQSTKQIRESSQTWNNIPIVALTAHANQGEKERCLEFGMNAYLTKPIDMKLLQETLKNFLTIPQQKDSIVLDAEQIAQFDAFQMEGEPDVLMETIALYLKNSQEQIVAVQTGLQQENWKQISMAIHSLRSTSSMLGATDLANVILEMEQKIEENQYSVLPSLIEQFLDIYERSCRALENLMEERRGSV